MLKVHNCFSKRSSKIKNQILYKIKKKLIIKYLFCFPKDACLMDGENSQYLPTTLLYAIGNWNTTNTSDV